MAFGEWRAVAKSVIGTSHRSMGEPCQDASDYRIECDGKVILGAVSDGMSSAALSHEGARWVVEHSLNYLVDQKVWVGEPSRTKLRNIFRDLLQQIHGELTQVTRNHQCSPDDLNCTLVVFVATWDWMAAMQIGDGLIVVRQSEKQRYRIIFQPDKGEYANETTPVTSARAEREMSVRFSRVPVDFICAATDGIENVALVRNKKSWTPYQRFFDPLQEAMVSDGANLERDVEDFLDGDALNSRTDDDKTLLLCRLR